MIGPSSIYIILSCLVILSLPNTVIFAPYCWNCDIELGIRTMIVAGDWLGKATNIKIETNGAVGYVGSSLTVHNPLFFVHKL